MEGKIASEDSVEFLKIDKSDLEAVSVVAQSLDNQWVPQDLLSKMMRAGLSLSEVEGERLPRVRSEYLRTLVNARQLIVNRAYLYNNPAVFRDFVQDGEARETFKELLGSGAVIPFLFNETSPHQQPNFSTESTGFAAWEQLCQEVRMRCLRLSWVEDENREYIRGQLIRRFSEFAQSANLLDAEVLARDYGLGADYENGLRHRLTDVSRRCVDWSAEERPITRENLYREFVVGDGTNPSEGKFDESKPFSAELKQLLDLNYNVNLPDALEKYPLTPIDSLNRTALQEWHTMQKKKEITAEELATMLRRTGFALAQEGLYIESLSELSLPDIMEIRKAEEWHRYIKSMEDLLADPLGFADEGGGAARVYDSYVQLAGVVTNIAMERQAKARTERWTPVAELVVDVAGAALSILLVQPPVLKILGAISPRVGMRAAPLVVRLIVRGLTERGSRAKIDTSIDFMRRHFDNASKEWKELVSTFEKLPGFEQARGELSTHKTSNIDYAEYV